MWADPAVGAEGALDASRLAALKEQYRRPASIPFPRYNPYAGAKAELGKALFFDLRLSASGRIACAGCHRPELAFGDGLAKGIGDGGRTLRRRTPTILNAAFGGRFTWDGRLETLEAAVLGPIAAKSEMNQPLDALPAKLAAIAGYRPLFEAAFPGQGVTLDGVALAVATFMRTVVATESPFDRWIAGDEGAVGEDAKRGFLLFNGKAGCAACHRGWAFTDHAFHDIGLLTADLGRGEHVPDDPLMRHAFKTPTLRDVALRAPYMHDGSMPTLQAVISHYDSGFVRRPSLAKEMRRLDLDAQEKVNLLAFLAALTGDGEPVHAPPLPE
jgi:cytochrome c peroxidase